jgi:hypothetical protein
LRLSSIISFNKDLISIPTATEIKTGWPRKGSPINSEVVKMGTPFQLAIPQVLQDKTDTAEIDRTAEINSQFINMHCSMITDILVIKSKINEAKNGRNNVVRSNATDDANKLIATFIDDYAVEEYADIYHGKIHDEDIHRFPYKHSKLTIVAGETKPTSYDWGQWVVDCNRTWLK